MGVSAVALRELLPAIRTPTLCSTARSIASTRSRWAGGPRSRSQGPSSTRSRVAVTCSPAPPPLRPMPRSPTSATAIASAPRATQSGPAGPCPHIHRVFGNLKTWLAGTPMAAFQTPRSGCSMPGCTGSRTASGSESAAATSTARASCSGATRSRASGSNPAARSSRRSFSSSVPRRAGGWSRWACPTTRGRPVRRPARSPASSAAR